MYVGRFLFHNDSTSFLMVSSDNTSLGNIALMFLSRVLTEKNIYIPSMQFVHIVLYYNLYAFHVYHPTSSCDE